MTVAAPSSTYRLQIRAGFTLSDAAEVVGYLADLGVGAVYLSPLLQATRGSDHGYDITDVTRVDPERGGEEGWQALLAAAREAGLGVVVDIVPNHLGIAVPVENPAWWDVLKHGQDSAYASWFDIDWSRGRVLVPVLGDEVELELVDDELHYFEHRFPLAPGSYAPGDDPEAVHDRQHYELVHFRRGNSELNYRRFFAVTTLAGVRVEDPRVFEATHVRVKDWVGERITGLRVDHPDGLVDPGAYLTRLRALAPDAWITVEKILEPGERLPADWPVEGTTGYDAMREVNGLFVDGAAEPFFTDLYRRLTHDERSLEEHIETGKRMVTTDLLPAEVSRMARLVEDLGGGEVEDLGGGEVEDLGGGEVEDLGGGEVEDLGGGEVERALAEVAVAFTVYRSYLPEGVADLDAALAVAAQRNPDLTAVLDRLSPRLHDADDELARRMQQLSGATMAKGIEDTAYYRYARFVALNEVGGNPDDFGIDLDAFHAAQARRQTDQPRSMTSLSTHDTKRGEDVRARLAVLSELGPAWQEFAELFLARTRIPNLAFAYFTAQTLVGVGPVERERLHAYVEKAMREASDGTGWVDQDEAFEKAVHDAVDLAYDDRLLRRAWDALLDRVTGPGWSNALGQKVVQLTMPGVPDVYQGTEIWEDSLVDPDNRRPVDYAQLRRLLAAGPTTTFEADGRAKLGVVAAVLRLRRDRPEAFTGYRALTADGPAAEHLVAFDRGQALTLATRLPVGLAEAGGWGETTLALDGAYRDVVSGTRFEGTTRVADLLAGLPVAVLVAD